MSGILEKEIKKGLRLHDFHYLGGELYCEKVPVREMVETDRMEKKITIPNRPSFFILPPSMST